MPGMDTYKNKSMNDTIVLRVAGMQQLWDAPPVIQHGALCRERSAAARINEVAEGMPCYFLSGRSSC